MFKLAELFVDIKARDSAFQSQLESTRQGLSAWGVAVGSAVGTLAAGAIASAASSIAGFFSTGIKGAVDLQETLSKVNAIFGDSAGIITAQADQMAARFGVVKQEYLDAASSFGSAFKSAGMAAGEAAEMGNKLAKLGMDMASFGNASNADVFTALSAALRGENDPLERFGPRLSAAKVEAEALASGLARTKDSISDLAKQQATLNLILRETADQQGDLERTADGSANQWRRLTGTLTNMAIELGGKLEPALNSVLQVGNNLIDSLGPGIDWLGGMFQAFSDSVVETVATVSLVWRNLGAVWEIVTIQAHEHFLNLAAFLSVLPENFANVAGWIGRNWYQILADAFALTGTIFSNFEENLARFYTSVASKLGEFGSALWKFLEDPFQGFQFDFSTMLEGFEWKPLTDGFEATMEELPELVAPAWADLQSEIDAVGDRIEANETARLDRIDAARKKAGPKADAGPRADADKFKPQSFDASEYAQKVRLTILGGDDVPKKQLAATEKIEKNTREAAEAAKKPAVAVFG